MDEEFDLEQQQEVNTAELQTQSIDVSEEIESVEETESPLSQVDIYEGEEVIVETENMFPSVNGIGDATNHATLSNRDAQDQHPISSITGLRGELNEIEKLQTVYSDKIGHANYFIWEDENPAHENRTGFFVSLCSSGNEICLYDGTSNVFGVTVGDAAFIGGQDDIVRDDKYALVVSNGKCLVRCDATVAVGDYVSPNAYGVAAKSTYGYRVAELSNVTGATMATIILDITPNQINTINNTVTNLSARVSNTESNIASAINVANSAHQSVQELNYQIQTQNTNINRAVAAAEEASGDAASAETQVASAIATAALAKSIAETAVTTAESIRTNAAATANSTLASLNTLIEDLEPVTTWTSGGNTGAEYLVQHINNGVATKTEVQTLNNLSTKNASSIEKSAKNFNTFISTVSSYNLGLYSQSYGLYNKAQALDILDDGMVYVPYDPNDTTGNYAYNESYTENNNMTYSFMQGRYYTWTSNGTGYGWLESASGQIAFSPDYVDNANGLIPYWVATDDVTHNNVSYEAYSLYKWMNAQWTKVTTLSSVNGRMVSAIRQDVNRIDASVTSVAGSVAALSATVNNNSSMVNAIAAWETQNGKTLATTLNQAEADSAKIAMVVENVNGQNQIKTASIVTAINDSASSVTLDADHINLNGAATFNNNVTISTDGKITAQYANISGTINATSGSFKGTVTATSGSFTGSVNATSGSFTGKIYASEGTIGGINFSNGNISIPNSHIESVSTSKLDGQVGNSQISDLNVGKLNSGTTNTYFNFANASIGGDRTLKYTNGTAYTEIDKLGITVHNTGSQFSASTIGSTISVNMVNANASFQFNTSGGTLTGTWKYANGTAITSDRNAKHDIKNIDIIYETIYNNLSPKLFKYNDGLSDRTHIGFIAQEVEDAVLNSGLTTKEFAPVCYDIDDDGNKVGYGVRYSEIVPLNTWQIQKLKSRVEELEKEIELLKNK